MSDQTVVVGPCVCGGYGILKPEGAKPCHEPLSPDRRVEDVKPRA